MSDTNKQNLMSYLPLLVIFGSFLITWGVLLTKISANEKEINDSKYKISTMENKLVDIQIRLERIDANVSFIKNKIE